MDRWNWDRIAAGMGIVFAALFVAAFFTFGEGPGLGDSAEEVASYYVDDRGQIVVGMILFGLAMIAALWFVAAVATMLRNAGEVRLGATAIAAGGAMIGVALVILSLQGAQISGIAAADPEAATTINSVLWSFEVVISWPVAAFVLATAVGAKRAGIFPAWLSWASLATAIVLALGGTTWAKDGFWAPDGEYTMLTIIAFLIWIIVASWTLTQRLTATAPRPAAAAV